MLMGMIEVTTRSVAASSGSGATLSYTTTDVSQAWDNTGAGLFSTVNIGTVSSDRIIVVTIGTVSNSSGNGRPSSVTVGGVSMTLASSRSGETTGGIGNNYVYYLLASSGVLNSASTSVVVTTPFSQNVAISVGTLTGSTGATINSFNGDDWSGGGTVADPRGVPNDLAAVTVASGGIVVCGGQIDRNTTMTSNSSINTILDLSLADSSGQSHTFLQSHGSSGGPAFNGATNFNASFVITSFQP